MFALAESGMAEQGLQEAEMPRNNKIPSGQCEVWAGLGNMRVFCMSMLSISLVAACEYAN